MKDSDTVAPDTVAPIRVPLRVASVSANVWESAAVGIPDFQSPEYVRYGLASSMKILVVCGFEIVEFIVAS